MDAIAWLFVATVAAVTITTASMAPRWRRDNLRRQLEGGGGSLSGLGAGFDAVWRPSAEESRSQWEAQVQMPAPAPAPGDKGRVQDGRIVIDLPT